MEFHEILATVVAAGALLLILVGKMHRAIVAWGACIILFIIGKSFGFLDEIVMVSYIDFNVIGLLVGMMTIASMLDLSGFFEFIAVKVAKISRGSPALLIIILGTANTVISLFIDNTTSIILLVPMTIMICNRLGISPIPIILAEALLADTGGVGTLVGDPPNIMIASASGFGFNDFIIRLGPAVFMAWLVTMIYLLIYYRKWNEKTNVAELMEMNEWDHVKDRPMMMRTIVILLLTIVAYTLNDALFHFEVATVALIGGGLALLASRNDIYKVMERIEWPVLLFFAGLYMIVGTIEELGLLSALGTWMTDIAGGDMTLMVILFIWVSAIASALVDNIPFTAAMLPIIEQMGELGMPTTPLYWALAMGVGFGGNGTPIGSTANVIAVSMSERWGHPISTGQWIKVGSVVMVLTCAMATLFMVLFGDFFMHP